MKMRSPWKLLPAVLACTCILVGCASAPKVVSVPAVKGTVVDHITALPLNNVLVAVLLDKEIFAFGTHSKERWDEFYTFTQGDGGFELPPLKRLGSTSRTFMGKASVPTPQIVAFKTGYKLKRVAFDSNGKDIHIILRPLAQGKKNPHDEATRLIHRLLEYGDGKTSSEEDEQALRRVQAELMNNN